MRKYFAILVLSALMACNNTANQSTEKKDSIAAPEPPKAAVAPVFKDQKISDIYTNYIKLKDALVTAKVDEAKTAAKELSSELKNYTGCENTSLIADKISNAKDIVAQRTSFTGLSSDLIALFKHTDLSGGKIYVQHCPMANNGDGGDWLSSDSKIQNPYYGSEMMECGAVVAEIKAK
jgi:hypothetical protein